MLKEAARGLSWRWDRIWKSVMEKGQAGDTGPRLYTGARSGWHWGVSALAGRAGAVGTCLGEAAIHVPCPPALKWCL